MENITSKYETIFVVNGELTEEAAAEIAGKFKALIEKNGTIEEVNDWGKKRLAYPINYVNDGYYTVVTFTAGHSFTKELDRIYNITDGILRSIIVKVGE